MARTRKAVALARRYGALRALGPLRALGALRVLGPIVALGLLGLAAPHAAAAEEVTYRCASGRTIRAAYESGAEGGARLAFDGRNFDLYRVRSASGARYATEQGLRPDHGLQWWIKGDGATLSEMVMDHTAPAPEPMDTCQLELAKP